MDEEELLIFSFANEEELQERVTEACNSSVDVVVVTGAYTLELVRQRGLKPLWFVPRRKRFTMPLNRPKVF